MDMVCQQGLRELLEQQELLRIQIAEVRNEEISEVVSAIREQIKLYGINVDDIFAKNKGGKGVSRGKVAPKFRDPVSGKTWTGRGMAPKWIAGKERAQYAI